MTGYPKIITAMLILGSVGLFVRAVDLPSSLIVLGRTLLGSLFLLSLSILTSQRINKAALRHNLPLLIPTGIVLGIHWVLLFEAFRYTTVPVAILSCYCAPLLVLLLSPILLKEALTQRKVLAFIAAAVGMILVTGWNTGGIAPLRGLTSGLLSAVFYALLIFLNKKLSGLSGIEITLSQLVVAAFTLIPYVALTGQGNWTVPDSRGIAALLVLGFVHSGFACWLYFSSMQELPGQSVALCSYLEPCSALFYSAIFLGEAMSPLQWFGALLILGGALWGELGNHKRT